MSESRRERVGVKPTPETLLESEASVLHAAHSWRDLEIRSSTLSPAGVCRNARSLQVCSEQRLLFHTEAWKSSLRARYVNATSAGLRVKGGAGGAERGQKVSLM